MHEKSEVGTLLKKLVTMTKNQFGKGVKVVRSANGLEFKSGPMRKFYLENGIMHQTSCVDTPQQNCRVERKHCHILNVGEALRFQAGLPLNF